MDSSLPTVQSASSSQGRSTFVTVLAWILIVFAGFATFISLFQAAMITFAFPEAKFWTDAGPVRGLENVPPIVRFMAANVALFFVAGWILFLATFISALALLRRKNWARLYFVVLMSLGIVWNIAGLWLQFSVLSSFSPPVGAPPEFGRNFEVIRIVMGIANTVFALAVAVLFAWIIKRLLSPSIRAEFNVP
jgi:hypothetical protein